MSILSKPFTLGLVYWLREELLTLYSERKREEETQSDVPKAHLKSVEYAAAQTSIVVNAFFSVSLNA